MFILLNETILWWHWIVFGVVLLIIEMNTGTFVTLGLGLAMMIVGLLDLFMDLSFITEIIIFSVCSILFFVTWKRWLKTPTVTSIGQSNHTFDTLGTVSSEILKHQKGRVTFDTPVLGTSTWIATSDETLSENTRIKIVDIKGQLMLVSPHTH
ncbi:MAG: NfeD family protein [Sulfurovum sp.]|nr:NfeD family protein [Sulfurovum sp.]